MFDDIFRAAELERELALAKQREAFVRDRVVLDPAVFVGQSPSCVYSWTDRCP